MISHEPFLRAILDAPDDDGPRLIYADWLEERGDPRGEFIRVQCALARGADGPQRGALEARQQKLLAAHRREWSRALWDLDCAPLGVAENGGFRRGLLEDAEMDAAVFLGRSEELFRAAPLRNVTLRRAAGRLAELSASPWLERLAGLCLADNGVAPSDVVALALSPFLTGLAVLDLSGNGVGDVGAAALAGSRGLGGLIRLYLGEAAIGPEGARRLADSPHWPRLAELDLGDNRVGEAGAEALAASPTRAGLTELSLDENGVGDAGAIWLATSPHLAGLTALHLNGNGISNAGALALAYSPCLNRLTVLSLLENPIREEAAEAVRRRFRGARVA